MKKGIIIFQKNLIPGRVKSRIAEMVGDQKALEIYQVLVNYTHQQVEHLECKKLLYFSDYVENSFENDKEYQVFIQSSGDLGQKMGDAFKDQFENGFDQLLIIGTDCAEITLEVIEKAFEKLENSEVVIGPAKDGGYYLLGMKRFISGLFYDIPWSSAEVFNQTCSYLITHQISFDLLPTLSDVDYLEDWVKVKERLMHPQSK
ncbi:TIGR04282 family arsenosugar biosynthesis glycosyltransferase [Algoriphagus lutimaris]|uniref:TIGR04282 family arsenosugar biosynthesis glycosyltransferase n=1 Tax=Algoriphagus lutimaris TaxID=613197 RepID=UPI00196A64DD|nr:TIGR04282 family arsenosugar biosynthesis glycosyltransferase [Algoriphagus lutimaris]MBN3519159.1 TIGR04282 family arsenosugar biosynthesis glycosyltransferase [Algoriphagus lutimaris]